MNYLFGFIMMVALLYVLFKYRNFDYFTVALFSTFAYCYPGLLGKLRPSAYVDDTVEINFEVYVCIITYVVLLFLFILFVDKYKLMYNEKPIFKNERKTKIREDWISNVSVVCVELLGVILMVYVFDRYGNFTLNFNKMELLAQANRFTEYLKYIALFSFVYAFISKGKWIIICRILAIILIGYTFLLGHRSFIVLGLIGIVMNNLDENHKVRLSNIIRKHFGLFVFAIIAVLFFFFIKGVFAPLISGQYDLVISRLTDPDYYVNQLLGSEANTIMMNLQQVCETNMHYSVWKYFLGVLQLIPFIGGSVVQAFGYKTFETELNERFNTQLDLGIGIGSTYLGEAYAMGGFISLVIVLIVTFSMILVLVKMRSTCRSNITNAYFSVILPYCTFYIHRNSLPFLLVAARAYLYILLLTLLIRWFIRNLCRKPNKKRV